MNLLRQVSILFVLAGIMCLPEAIVPAAAASPEYQRTLERYAVPDVTLINQDGKRVKFSAL